MIVESAHPVLLVGGGPVAADDIAEAAGHCDLVIAVDGGANSLFSQGLTPHHVVGDMDSVSAEAQRAFANRVTTVAEQETTDFDKALRRIRAPLVLAAGFAGGRQDHALAAINVMLRYPDRPTVLIGPEDAVCLCPPALRLDLPKESRLSLFPMGQVRCQSTGLEWPTEGIEFAPDGRIGTSNRVAGPVELVPSAARLLLILPRTALIELVRQLLQSERWPAP